MVPRSFAERFATFSKQKKIFIASLPIVAGVVFTSLNQNLSHVSVSVTVPSVSYPEPSSAAPATPIDIPDYEYVIKSGDSLSVIFEKLGFSYKEMMKIMETDLNYLKLDTLKPGDTLKFWRSDDHKFLQKMELQFSLAERALYSRLDDGSYSYDDVTVPGVWKDYAITGTIQGSFSKSVNALGIGNNEIEQIVSVLGDKINFTRDLRAGDKFEVVEARQFVDGKATGNKEIQAIKVFNRGQVITAYLYKDGQYYDKDGRSLERAFQRKPFVGRYRMSSSFDPKRRHPVTGRIAPHNGTDWALPTGTSIVSTGDGIVTLVRNHPYAGKYVVIQHGNNYKTRYLHLSKILVKRGQRVKRGQKIALSGRTGRVTGPHIHYELIVKGRPVNAVTAKIPMAHSVPKSEMKDFIAQRNRLDALLNQKQLQLASNSSPNAKS
ncbi:peptidoglycan DD-metalloendopeptidase family protein [Vibrio marisflavi]|uniref:Murein DD-endopeptidase MepM n=1 Tax=Vibrio marisflavi CECT 7928 TaxID=634439 RepID=A0ABN8E0D8_9VIBR|nr:peptidoglycan DD-metalloendopeptidase family protein [Vibrio marisflavi]CAH0537732.1 Murein DD-endopeptidase MepM [Vibrio marisflavi CECT 7928]